MSDTLIAYVISVIILAVLALSVPCIDVLAKLLRTPFRDEHTRSTPPHRSRGSSQRIA